MTEETLHQLILSHHHFPSALLSLIQGADETTLRERPAPGKWSPLEILAHLRDEEIEDFRKRARDAIEGNLLELNVRPEEWLVERKYNEMDPGSVYLDFARERADSCRWLETLGIGDLEKALEHPKFGPIRAGDFIAAWRVHDLLHLRQLATALVTIAAKRFDGWAIEYAGTIPKP